jgi:hypothetical protein
MEEVSEEVVLSDLFIKAGECVVFGFHESVENEQQSQLKKKIVVRLTTCHFTYEDCFINSSRTTATWWQFH